MIFSVFTPTFNRAHTLPRLYESLKNQTSKNFEWIIVDDGSSDGTEQLIEKYNDEGLITIKYYRQPNQGKHIAINQGMKLAAGDFFLVVDSDDYLLVNCIETCSYLSLKIADKPEISGFTFIRFTDNVKYDISKYGKIEKTVKGDIHYDWEFYGELIFCYKMNVAINFPFPQFPEEKFCPESLVHRRIARNFKILFTDHVLMGGAYLEDGLSAKYAMIMEKSPRAAMLSYKEKIWDAVSPEEKKKFAAFYWNIALKAKHISWTEKLRGIPIVLSFNFWKDRLLK